MIERTELAEGTDDQISAYDRCAIDRRTTVRASAADLAALGVEEPGTSTVTADRGPESTVAVAGAELDVQTVERRNTRNISEIDTLLGPFEIEASDDDGRALVIRPTIESSLFTDARMNGEESTVNAGVLGWIEITGDDTTGGEWQMVTADGGYIDPPSDASALTDAFETLDGDADWLTRGVVAFNTRDLELDRGIENRTDEDLLALYLRTRRTHAFDWIAPDVSGENFVRLRGATSVYVDDDTAEAQAIVGNTTIYVEPVTLHPDAEE